MFGIFNCIAGGTAKNAFIGGGCRNMVTVLDSTVVAGLSNIVRGNMGFIGSGRENIICNTANYSTIVAGASSRVCGNYSSIVGGAFNKLTTSGKYKFIGGGHLNSAASRGNIIVGGQHNEVIGAESIIVGGFGNKVSGPDQFIGGGYNNTINGGGSSGILGGNNNTLFNSSSAFLIGSNLSAFNVNNYTLANNLSAQRQLRAGGSLQVGDGSPGNGNTLIYGDLATQGNILSGGVNLTDIIQSVSLSGTSNFTTQVGTHGDLTLDVAKGQIIGATEFIQFVTNIPDASNPNEDVLGTEDYKKLSGPFEFRSAS